MTWRTSYRCLPSISAQLWSVILWGCPTRSPLSISSTFRLSPAPIHKIPCLWAGFGPCISSHGWISLQLRRRWLVSWRCFQWLGLPFRWRSYRNRWTCLFGSVSHTSEPNPSNRFTKPCRLICRPLAKSHAISVRRVEEWSHWESWPSIKVQSRASTLLPLGTE